MARPIRLYCVAKRLPATGIVLDGTGVLVKLPVKHLLNASSFAVRSAGVSFVMACVFARVAIGARPLGGGHDGERLCMGGSFGSHAGAFSASSGQMRCQSVGRISWRVTIRLVFCPMATHTFSSRVLYPYETLVRCLGVVPTLSAKACLSPGVKSKKYFLSSIAPLYTNWCTLSELFAPSGFFYACSHQGFPLD